ncbi:uncharacterized protein ACJ7VT_021734, partial [Polymixia lowei]
FHHPKTSHLFTSTLPNTLFLISFLHLTPYLKASETNSTGGSIAPPLSGPGAGGPPATFAPGLRKYPQERGLSSLTASSSQAKALLASLSASSLSAEALLLSSTFRHHRLLREQRASSLPAPNGRCSSSSSSSSSSNGSGLNSYKECSSKALPRGLFPSSSHPPTQSYCQFPKQRDTQAGLRSHQLVL